MSELGTGLQRVAVLVESFPINDQTRGIWRRWAQRDQQSPFVTLRISWLLVEEACLLPDWNHGSLSSTSNR